MRTVDFTQWHQYLTIQFYTDSQTHLLLGGYYDDVIPMKDLE